MKPCTSKSGGVVHSTTRTLLLTTILLLSTMVLAAPTGSAASEPGPDWEQERLQFAYRPDNHERLEFPPETIATGLPFLLMGADPEEGGAGTGHGAIGDWVGLVQNGVLDLVTNDGEGLLVIGDVPPGSPAMAFWDAIGAGTGQDVTYVGGPMAIAFQSFEGFAMIGIVSSSFQLTGPQGLTDDENTALIGRSTDILDFVTAGGGFLAFTQSGLADPWGFLGGVGTVETGLCYNTITPTALGQEVGLNVPGFDFDCWHDTFSSFPASFTVLAWREGAEGSQAAALSGYDIIPNPDPKHPYPDQLGVYLNWVEGVTGGPDAQGGQVLSLRLFGEDRQNAPDLYSERQESFVPEAIPQDVVTFNPAIVLHTDKDFTKSGGQEDFSWMRGCDEEDANLKKHLRTWYEPDHAFGGPRMDVGLWNPPTVADAIQLESTYTLVSASSFDPLPFCAGTRVPFPTEGTAVAALSLDLGESNTSAWPQPGLDTMREVRITHVEADPDEPARGVVRMERQGEVLAKGEAIQMFDHVYRYEGIGTDFQGNSRAMFTVWYAGNTILDSPTTLLLGGQLGTQKWISRGNHLFDGVAHPADNPGHPRTSFLSVSSFTSDTVTFDLGKQIRGGDVFYVDGVRYEFPSVFVTADEAPGGGEREVLHHLTMRTPIPKSDPDRQGCPGADRAWTSVPNGLVVDHQREVCLSGQWQVQDWSVVSTQRIVQIDHDEPLPVDPPFNHRFYRQVDDTDVVLWQPGPDREDGCEDASRFPWGARNDAVPDGDGMPLFRLGHTYVTMQAPPGLVSLDPLEWEEGSWGACWDAEPTGFLALQNRVQGLDPADANVAPYAHFNFTPDPPFVHEPVTFTDHSLDPDNGEVVARLWDFGDGGTSTLEHPVHTYTSPGFYTVSLQVTDDSGATATATSTIRVWNPSPVANFTWVVDDPEVHPQVPIVGETIQFTQTSTDLDGTIIFWGWDFGDGSPIHIGQTPSHIYDSPGVYVVKLSVMDNLGQFMLATTQITIHNVPPVPAFENDPLSATVGESFTFTDFSFDVDGTIVSWEWDFGPDASPATSSSEFPPFVEYSSPGIKNVTLTVTDNHGASRTYSSEIEVLNAAPVPRFFANGDPGYLVNEVIEFGSFSTSDPDDNSAFLTKEWSFPGGTPASATGDTVSTSYATAGLKVVTLKVTDPHGASAERTKQIIITEAPPANQFPIADFAYLPLAPAIDEPVSFTGIFQDPDGIIVSVSWDFGTGSSTAGSPTHTFTSAGVHLVSLTVTDNGGLSNTVTAQVVVLASPPVASFEPDVYPFVANGPLAKFIDFSLEDEVPITRWDWDFGDGSTASFGVETDPSHAYTQAGTFLVTHGVGFDSPIKIRNATMEVDVLNPAPVPLFAHALSNPFVGEDVTFSDLSTDAFGTIEQWLWEFGDGNTADVQDPVHAYTDPGFYTVRLHVTDDLGKVATFTRQVHVIDQSPIAEFTYDPTGPVFIATPVVTTDLSFDLDSTIVSWEWDFGDGGTSTLVEPVHKYTSAGTFTLGLTVTDEHGAAATATKTVRVLEDLSEIGINWDAWSLDEGLPVLPRPERTDFHWVKEWCDDRLSTDLQQILRLDEGPSYTSYGIDSRPCKFTEFVFPDRSNRHSSLGLGARSALLADGVRLDSGKDDLTLPGPQKRLNFGDYHVMSSFYLQDGGTRLAFTHKPDAVDLHEDLDSSPTDGLRGDLYVQTVDTVLDETELFETTLRLYGASGEGPIDYSEYWHAFDPYAIGKDSVTFNPAIILHEDTDFTGHDLTFAWLKSCDESDSNLKKTMRMWYEPGHTYDGPRVESGATQNPTVADTIALESSYKLVDADSYLPRTMCEGGRVPFPVEGYTAYEHPVHGYSVEGHPQPGLNTMRSVRIGEVSGAGADGRLELIRRAVSLAVGDTVQMFDHLYLYQGVEEDFADAGRMKAKFRIFYLGNPAADSPQDVLIGGDQRHYVSRANALFDGPSHGWEPEDLPVRTSFIDLTGGTFNDTHVTFNVGKELAKDDTFYVTGVRYDIPAVYVTEDPLAGGQLGVQYLTMRTSLPKSDPNRGDASGADYTTVPNDLMEGSPSRETYDNPGDEWVVRDESVVSTQRIREFDFLDPLPLNPPFNGVSGESDDAYRMVDDTDVRLWEQGKDPASECRNPILLENGFPWGPRNDGVPDGNGLPLFPLGHTYLTMQDPPQEWIDCFDAEPTGYDLLGKRVDKLSPPVEPGINHNAWEFSGTGMDAFPVQVVRENTTLFWVSEWCEGRFSTNLLQIPTEDGSGFTGSQVDTEPCEYTEFVLPDQTNPLSELEAQLDTLKDDGVPAAIYKLLGGDYLVSTSFRLSGGSNWVDLYDADGDCVIGMIELMMAVNDWFDDEIPLFDMDPTVAQLGRVVADWQQSSANPFVPYAGCSG